MLNNVIKNLKKILKKEFLTYNLFIFEISINTLIPQRFFKADFREFIKDLEETHPDLYTAFGGKVFYPSYTLLGLLGKLSAGKQNLKLFAGDLFPLHQDF